MSYQAFALKYRPQKFDQVIGQEQVVSPLEKAISAKRIHHAYIFSGPRGVGKTSLARIFAKSINCRLGPTPDPCLKCPSCLEITSQKSLDVIEIDGASNRGIDEIRILRESAKLSPVSAKFKVYIIDEVHMLTKEAFNALLKILEEPPSHVKFIFATTDPQKVLPTILSRCQKFQFNLLSLNAIAEKLSHIAESENLKVDKNTLYTIAQAAEGSVRDAESLFDQVFPILSSGENLKDIFSFLGVIDENALNKLAGFLSDADLPAALDFIGQIKRDGRDLGLFLDSFLKYLRNFLFVHINPEAFSQAAEISPQSREFIISLSCRFSLAKSLKLIDLLIQAKEISRQLNTSDIPFELALIKFLHNDNFELTCPKNQAPESKNSESKKKPLPQNFSENLNQAEPETKPTLEKKSNKVKLNAEAAQSSQDGLAGQEKEAPSSDVFDDILAQPLKANWDKILSKMKKEKIAVASHLDFGRISSSSGKQVFISFSVANKFHKEILDNDKTRRFIEGTIKLVINEEVMVKFKIDENLGDGHLQEKINSEKKDQGLPEDKDNDFLNELIDTFDAKFHSDE